jgi:hypothetical protein
MNLTRREFVTASSIMAALGLAGCSRAATGGGSSSDSSPDSKASSVDLKEFESLALDGDAWKYDKENDCYYQLGLKYCLKPGSTSYESLAIFVPGGYFEGKKKGSSYTCTVKEDAKVGNFTSSTAPVLMPINSLRLSPQSCPTSYAYNGLSRYLSAGCVYVYSGFRGRSSSYESDSSKLVAGGAPWPAVDLKAAVRYIRYNKKSLPIDAERIFTFGYGAGGGLSAVMGSMGDSPLFDKYLDEIGAITHDVDGKDVSDAIFGSASWCPITSYDTIDSSYEWMMGQFSSDDARADGTWTAQFSKDLANAYGDYVNQMDLRDKDGNSLTLDPVEDGTYLAGTYYDKVLSIVEGAATDFFNDTSFPFTYTPSRMSDPCFPGDPNFDASASEEIDAVTGGTDANATATDQSASGTEDGTQDANSTTGVSKVQSTVYDSASSYISALNGDDRWLSYSSSAQSARVNDLWNYVEHCRKAEKSVCAFDALDRSNTTNQLFGIGDESTLHFDATASDLLDKNQDTYAKLSNWKADYVSDWKNDLAKKDSEDQTVTDRVNAMNPLYTLSGHYDGFGKATVAPHWRVNTGLFQSENSLANELNLASVLVNYDGVKDLSFTAVWAKGFELAEKSGNAQDNLITWVEGCCK